MKKTFNRPRSVSSLVDYKNRRKSDDDFVSNDKQEDMLATNIPMQFDSDEGSLQGDDEAEVAVVM